jgi:Trk K+ transport system NAD-binding subunit
MGLLSNTVVDVNMSIAQRPNMIHSSVATVEALDEVSSYQFSQQHLKMIHVRVSPVFIGRGRLYSTLTLPISAKVVSVIRQHETVSNLGAAFVRAGDEVVCLTDNEEQTRRYFMFGLI